MIQVFDRKQGALVQEQVFGDAWVKAAYQGNGPIAQVVGNRHVQKWVSRAAGWVQSSGFSKRSIPDFIAKYSIPMNEYVEPAQGFSSFNDFFIRLFKEGQRPFPQDPLQLGSPAEGRLTVFPIAGESLKLTIKGVECRLAELVGSPAIASQYVGGHAFVFRLCPVDYHRFHFPDAGRAGPSNRLGRELHSVNPAAHAKIPDVFLRNERQICLFESQNFGPLALLEVGAICVGRIVQTYSPGKKVERGAEKGYFAFGGSTTIMLTAKNWVHPEPDLLERTDQGIENLVRLGETIARAGSKTTL